MRKRPSISDIAGKLGLSVATVSNALNGKKSVSEKTRKKVVAIAKKLGYKSERRSTNKKSVTKSATKSAAKKQSTRKRPRKRSSARAVAFYFPSLIENELDYFMSEINLGIREAARENDLDPHMFPFRVAMGSKDLDFLKDSISDGKLFGAITVAANGISATLLETAKKANIPMVEIRPDREAHSGTVTFDVEKGAELAGKRFLEMGAERPAYIGGLSDEAKKIGFHKGLGPLVEALVEDQGGTTFHDGRLAFERLDPLENPIDAVLCANDSIAIGFMKAALDSGLDVPEDIAVVGCDDVRVAQFYHPSLTTIRLNPIEIGRSAVMLLKRMVEKNDDTGILVECSLILRESA